MRFLKSLFLVAVLCLSFAAGKTQAATVAVIPLINRVEFNTVEEEKVPNQIFYTVGLNALREKPGYMLIENDRLRHAIENNLKPYEMPTHEQMKEISKKSNVDILIAVELTNYGRKRLNKGQNEMFMQMDIKANVVTYNRLTGKYVKKTMKDDSPYDATMESRYNRVQESWTKLVRREFSRIVK